MPIYEEQCAACGYINERYQAHYIEGTNPCPKCGCETERIFSLYKPEVFENFTTTNIIEDGTPITVRGKGQLRQLESDHGVKLADGGAPPQTNFWTPPSEVK